jgi:hypothetical protein
MALAGLPRHDSADALEPDLRRYKSVGYTGIWLEDDVVRWTDGPDADQGFNGNWRLYNIFDFTLSTAAPVYRAYLRRVCELCREIGLEVYASFWMPKLNTEFTEYLTRNHPDAIGRSRHFKTDVPTLCMCPDGGGLPILRGMVEQFMRDFPEVLGLKIATEDNVARNCDDLCPHSHGTTKASHAANMFEAVQQGMAAVRPQAKLLLYPWFWEDAFTETIVPRLTGDYLVVTKMPVDSRQELGALGPSEPIFDDTLVVDEPGTTFVEWLKRVGPKRIVDMVPTGNGMDGMFLQNPPHPGRLFRRLRALGDLGVDRFLDFECGGHWAGSLEEAVRLYAAHPTLTETAFLGALAAAMYVRPAAQAWAVRGWRAFDLGFGHLPIHLGDTGSRLYSGRFGFAWELCIATPMVRGAFGGGDHEHKIHWFSPYNFFHGKLGLRLEIAFRRVLDQWVESTRCLAIADALEGGSTASAREAAAAEAHVIAVLSALNWCIAAAIDRPGSGSAAYFDELAESEMDLTRRLGALLQVHPWLWANNCWHPHRTPISQQGLGYLPSDKDTFEAKLRIMTAGKPARA